MTTILIQLSDEEREALQQMAPQAAASLPEAVQRVLRRVAEGARRPNEDELWERALSVAGKYKSGLKDLGRRHDDYLAEDFDE